jgi:hypothetical protein
LQADFWQAETRVIIKQSFNLTECTELVQAVLPTSSKTFRPDKPIRLLEQKFGRKHHLLKMLILLFISGRLNSYAATFGKFLPVGNTGGAQGSVEGRH